MIFLDFFENFRRFSGKIKISELGTLKYVKFDADYDKSNKKFEKRSFDSFLDVVLEGLFQPPPPPYALITWLVLSRNLLPFWDRDQNFGPATKIWSRLEKCPKLYSNLT